MSSLQCRVLLLNSVYWRTSQPVQQPEPEGQKVHWAYIAVGVNVLIILKVTKDLRPREVVKEFPGTEDISFLFDSQSLSDTAGPPYPIYELWTQKS